MKQMDYPSLDSHAHTNKSNVCMYDNDSVREWKGEMPGRIGGTEVSGTERADLRIIN